MKLIDADELKKELKERYMAAVQWKNATHFFKEKAEGEIAAYLEAIMILNNTETIESVKHAEWKEDGCLYKCSNCGHTEEYYDMSYCPCCGARMDMNERKTD